MRQPILYETGQGAGSYYVTAMEGNKGGKGYLVYRNGFTHAEICATIGFAGQRGLEVAIKEANRRAGGLAK